MLLARRTKIDHFGLCLLGLLSYHTSGFHVANWLRRLAALLIVFLLHQEARTWVYGLHFHDAKLLLELIHLVPVVLSNFQLASSVQFVDVILKIRAASETLYFSCWVATTGVQARVGSVESALTRLGS